MTKAKKTKTNDAELLKEIGTDPLKWAEAFTKVYENNILSFPKPLDRVNFVEWMMGWFANAIVNGMQAELTRIEKVQGTTIAPATDPKEYE